MTATTFKIIITDATYRRAEYLSAGFKHYEFAGLICIANHKELHIYRNAECAGLVPKYKLPDVKPYNVELVTMSKEAYIKHTDGYLNGPDGDVSIECQSACVVSVTLDNKGYKFIYLDGYEDEALKDTHLQEVSDQVNIVIMLLETIRKTWPGVSLNGIAELINLNL